MASRYTTRSAAVFVASFALAFGAAVSPAVATPAKEAANLAALKATWNTESVGAQTATCKVYAISKTAVISTGARTMMASRITRRGMSTTAWKRVLTTYYEWACSGPNNTPR